MNSLKYLIIISLFAGLLVSCNSKTEKKEIKEETFEYAIKLNVENLRGPVILLDRTTGKPVNTVYSRSNEFEIKGTLPVSKMHSTFVLHFPSKYSNPYMYPVAEACAINFEMENNTNIEAHYDSLLFAKVSNPHMDAVENFKKNNFPIIAEFDVFNQESFKTTERRSQKEQIAYANKGNALLKGITDALVKDTRKFAAKEEMAVLLAEWGGQLGIKKLDSLKNLLDNSLQTTAAMRRINAVMDYMKKQQKPQSLKVGQKAPDFTMKDTKGKEHSLSDFKGKYVVLDFWASWCGPCKREMPFMKKMYNKYKSKGLEMIGISTDKERSKWLKALKKIDNPYLQLRDNKGIAGSKYFVRGIPYVLVINPKGIIEGIARGEELDKLLEQKLK